MAEYCPRSEFWGTGVRCSGLVDPYLDTQYVDPNICVCDKLFQHDVESNNTNSHRDDFVSFQVPRRTVIRHPNRESKPEVRIL